MHNFIWAIALVFIVVGYLYSFVLGVRACFYMDRSSGFRALFRAYWVGSLVTFLLVILSTVSNAQERQLYASGQFPPGPIYHESDLPGLIDRVLPNPSYLVGQFVYLPSPLETADSKFFSTFGAGLSDSKSISFGNAVIFVQFFGNAPSLALGKVLAPNANDPLTLLAVKRSNDGQKIMVVCESLSAK
jgi:hypothetical protein